MVGHGLKVWDVYDGGDNTWLDYHGKKGEWAVAYHGTNLQFAECIMDKGLAPGQRQYYADHDDVNHPGQKVGNGVYVTPDISIADGIRISKILWEKIWNKEIIIAFGDNPYRGIGKDDVRFYKF